MGDSQENSIRLYYTTAIGLILSVCVIIAVNVIWDKDSLAVKILEYVFGLASLTGVGLSLFQINQANARISRVGTVAEQIGKAVEDNREEIKNLISVTDAAHLIEVIKNAQSQIRKEDYHPAVILIQTIKDELLRHEASVESNEDKSCLLSHVRDLNIAITSLANLQIANSHGNQVTIDSAMIHNQLENTRETIVKVEQHYKAKAYGTRRI